MPTKVLFFIFIFFSFQMFSQSEVITIVIKDKDTDAPIEDVSVSIVKTKQNLLSNANGVVTFDLDGNTNIQIKHSSYLTLNIRSNTLNKAINTIFLTSIVIELKDIIIPKNITKKI